MEEEEHATKGASGQLVVLVRKTTIEKEKEKDLVERLL